MSAVAPADVARPSAALGWGLITAMAVLAHPVAILLVVATVVGSVLTVGLELLAVPIVWVLFGLMGVATRRRLTPGRVVRAVDEPELAALVRKVAERLDFHAPLLVRVVPTADAGLTPVKTSGVHGYAILLGFPLLRRLSVGQLAALVAHEIAHHQHLANRRDRLLDIMRSVLAESLGNRIRLPRAGAARLLRATQPYTWHTEVVADARSAEVAGTATTRSALRQISLIVTAFDHLAPTWLSVLAEDGAYPEDLYEAFDTALDDPHVVRRTAAVLAEEDAVDPYAVASHPPLDARLAAVAAVAAVPDRPGADWDDSRPLSLRQADVLERWCVKVLTPEPEPGRGGRGEGRGRGRGGAREDEKGPRPARVLDTDPGRFDFPAEESAAALMAATGRDSVFAAVEGTVAAVVDGSWPQLVRVIEPGIGAVLPPARTVAGRGVLADHLSQVISGLLCDAGWERASRWVTNILITPGGEVVDVREVIQLAVGGGDVARLRALITAAAESA